MNRQQQVFIDTIKVFHEEKILQHVIVIGSWGEYIYERYNIPNTDIEFKPIKEFFPSNLVPIVTNGRLELMP